MWNNNELDYKLVGRKVLGVYLDYEILVFKTDQGMVAYSVDGDCCSTSSFHDIIGVDKLIAGGPVLKIEEVEASESCVDYHEEYDDSVQNYGYAFVVEHPEFGEVTSVVSFRNNSNGYYGGWMYGTQVPDEVGPFVTHDVVLS